MYLVTIADKVFSFEKFPSKKDLLAIAIYVVPTIGVEEYTRFQNIDIDDYSRLNKKDQINSVWILYLDCGIELDPIEMMIIDTDNIVKAEDIEIDKKYLTHSNSLIRNASKKYKGKI